MSSRTTAYYNQPKMNENPVGDAKVDGIKDICKVWEYFRYKDGTTLDAAKATGVLRNSITWYVAQLIEQGDLWVIAIKPDSTTGYKAKYYSSDPNKKPSITVDSVQLNLFD